MSERGSFVTQYFYCRKCLNAVVGVLREMDIDGLSVIMAPAGELVPIIAAGKARGMSFGEELRNFDFARWNFEAAICHDVTIAVIPERGEPQFFRYRPRENDPPREG